MTTIYQLVRRNILLFFRERTAVFFSFLTVIIIIVLYALFLGEIQLKSIRSIAGDSPYIRELVDSWLMAGLLAVNTVTLSFGVLGIMIEDADRNVYRDFILAPIRRSTIVASYIISTWVICTLISVVTFVIAEIYIVSSGGRLLSLENTLKTLLLILISVVTSTSIMFYIATFIKSLKSFATINTIVGTIIGFITGIYIPLGQLPETVQFVIKSIPFSYDAVLLRQIMMEEPLRQAFANAPPEVLHSYKEMFGVSFYTNGSEFSQGLMMLILLGSGFVFFILSTYRVSRKKF